MLLTHPNRSQSFMFQSEVSVAGNEIAKLLLRIVELLGGEPLKRVKGLIEQDRKDLILALKVPVDR